MFVYFPGMMQYGPLDITTTFLGFKVFLLIQLSSTGQVESDANFEFILDYLGSFVDDFPRIRELEAMVPGTHVSKKLDQMMLWQSACRLHSTGPVQLTALILGMKQQSMRREHMHYCMHACTIHAYVHKTRSSSSSHVPSCPLHTHRLKCTCMHVLYIIIHVP